MRAYSILTNSSEAIFLFPPLCDPNTRAQSKGEVHKSIAWSFNWENLTFYFDHDWLPPANFFVISRSIEFDPEIPVLLRRNILIR